MKTVNIFHDTLSIQDLVCQHMSCKNVIALNQQVIYFFRTATVQF